MLNLEKCEKSKGIVLFAFNTNVDYVTIADRASRLIAHNLKLPITLITDITSDPKFKYDQIVRIENDTENFRYDQTHGTLPWKNFGRYLAYELSPYDETILVDTDYLILTDGLLKLLDTGFDYKLMHHSVTPVGPSYEMMGETSLPYVWATVVLFRKTKRARLFFNLIGRIQRNYRYYRALYNIRESNYRNDYAFAIANIILSGYSINEDQGIPWRLFTIEEKIKSIVLDDNFLRIRHTDNAIVMPYQDIHIMDKEYLQSKDFGQVVEAICGPI